MALSNITREPRREITEQLVGLLVVLAVIGVDYVGVKWLGATKPADVLFGMVLGFLVTPFAILLGVLVMIGARTWGSDMRTAWTLRPQAPEALLGRAYGYQIPNP